MGKVVLERALSKLGVLSRSQTRHAILEGRLKVNGVCVCNPDELVVPEADVFELDGKRINASQPLLIMLHKPRGYVTTRSDEKGRKTVFDLLPENLKHLHAVGRLDMHTSGLLLLTNDTQFSNRMTDPVSGIEREYVVECEGKLIETDVDMLVRGVRDEGVLYQAKSVSVRKSSNRESQVMVTLTEGKNREIRRMFEAIGHPVIKLKRIRFGIYKLGDLVAGKYIQIN